jgi:5-methyltetrahydropteroyltriglutamate--homocysteine methyltransferase
MLCRADQLGSLLRPAKLLEARAARTAGRMTLEQLRELEDKAILDALEMQRETGIQVFTDGEYRRSTFRSGFAEAVEGTVQAESGRQWSDRPIGAQGDTERVVGGKLRQIRRLTAHESSFLKQHAPGICKVTVPSAGYLGCRAYRRGITDKVYPTVADLLRDIAVIIRGEISALIEEGVPYIQLDAPGYAAFVDETQRQRMREDGVDLDRAFEEFLMADNQSVQGLRRDGITLAIHICRGNSRSNWHSQGGYEPIAEKLFNKLEISTFLLEYDTERAGGFEPLRFVPKGKHVVLGLVSTKQGRLEPQDGLIRRIDEASKYVPIENLSLSPQCGFASGAAGNLITWDDQRRKLELVAQTARKVWG